MQQHKRMSISIKIHTKQLIHKCRWPFNQVKCMKASSMIRRTTNKSTLCLCRESFTIRMAWSSPKYQMTCKEWFKLTTIKICHKWSNSSWFSIRSKACISIIYSKQTLSHSKIIPMTYMQRTTSNSTRQMRFMLKVQINLFTSQQQSTLIIKSLRREVKIKMKWTVSIWCTNNNKSWIANNWTNKTTISKQDWIQFQI